MEAGGLQHERRILRVRLSLVRFGRLLKYLPLGPHNKVLER